MNSSGDSTFKQLYLKRLIKALNGLKKPSNSSCHGDEDDKVSCSSRNIKLAADVSLAMTANQAAWGQALMNILSSNEENRPTLKKILGPKKFQAIMAKKVRHQSLLVLQSRLRRAHMQKQKSSKPKTLLSHRSFYSERSDSSSSSSSRSHLVKRRTKQLQGMVPGGNSMDTSSLLRETADYIISLKTQVEVLHSLVNSVNNNQHPQ